jgi:hypothetical protein
MGLLLPQKEVRQIGKPNSFPVVTGAAIKGEKYQHKRYQPEISLRCSHKESP